MRVHSTPTLNLVVIKVNDLPTSLAFYGAIGLELIEEKHGSGPIHYSCAHCGAVFEIYPRDGAEIAPDSIRIGFQIANLDSVLADLENNRGKIAAGPRDSKWGRRAVVRDPDGYTVELIQLPLPVGEGRGEG
jgi:catechol 2,3-dioxygenase-like lactoylglutathione lyase family enzyme